jgi:polyisoprenoid-binding protein YceI
MSNLPLAPGTWELDAAHSAVTFKVRHLGLSNVRGRFRSFAVVLDVGATLAETKINATIDVTSIDTNQADRDAHLLSTDFFAADANPSIEFTSTAISRTGDQYSVAGDLTINGITLPATLAVEFTGVEIVPQDGLQHAGFLASTVVARDDFGIDFNMPLGFDQVAIGQKIAVEIDLEFTHPSATNTR